ncbi:16036_t:CDS:2, partial [Dentiscutata erythropus]
NDKEKTDLIAKLEYDVSLIKEQDKSMVCNQIVTNVSQDIEPGISDSYPLQHRPPTESSPKEDIYISNIKSSIPPEQKKEQGLIQEISTSIKDQNDITRISQNNVCQNHITEVASDQDIICLYQNACDAEKDAIKANQEEILCWCFYAKKFKGMVKDFIANGRVGEKKAKGQ